MLQGLKFAAIALLTLLVAEPAFAQVRSTFQPSRISNINKVQFNTIRPVPPLLGVRIRPSQAAAIAQGLVANSKVVGVKLLPSGSYAVTLRTDTYVTRVIVNGQDGSIE